MREIGAVKNGECVNVCTYVCTYVRAPAGVEVELQAATVDQQGCSWWAYGDVAHDPDRKPKAGKWPGPWPAWLPTYWKVGFGSKCQLGNNNLKGAQVIVDGGESRRNDFRDAVAQ